MSEPLKIFITYAHRNTSEKEELKTRLTFMEQQDEITIWHDNEILPGDRWREAISNNLAESDILLYLVSADSLVSENCNKELSEGIKNTDKNIIIILSYLRIAIGNNINLAIFKPFLTEASRLTNGNLRAQVGNVS